MRTGDIVFIAAGTTQRPVPQEHAAIVFHGTDPASGVVVYERDLSSPEDVRRLRTIGLPESAEDELKVPQPSLRPHSHGEDWQRQQDRRRNALIAQGKINVDSPPRWPDPECAWNLAGRAFDSADDADFAIRRFLAVHSRSQFTWQREMHYVPTAPDSPPDDPMTNCVGLVASILQGGRKQIITFPARYPFSYPDPYRAATEERAFPSPGHLAKAVSGTVSIPYTPSDSEDAAHWAPAARIRLDCLNIDEATRRTCS
jgi:hypothetical protein